MTRISRPARATRVVRLAEWALPPRAAPSLEILERLPDGPGGTSGHRPPLLFVHGLTLGAWSWRHWMDAAAAAGWPAYAVSLRGHGGSRSPDRGGPALLRDYVADVMEAITRLPEPPVLVGHSLGGVVVQYVLERYPARAGVLVAPVAADTGLGTVLRLVRHSPRAAPALLLGRPVGIPADMMVHDDADDVAMRRIQERSVALPTAVRYQVLVHARPRVQRCPLLVVGSTDDPLVASRDLRRTARQYGADLVEVPGMRHALMLDTGWQAPLDAMLTWVGATLRSGTAAGAVRHGVE